MAITPRGIFHSLATPLNLARIGLRARNSPAVIIHNGRLKSVLPMLAVPLFCHRQHKRVKKPSDLAIVLLHNRSQKSLMERCLDYIGVEDYTVLHVPPRLSWRHTFKITYLLEYLKSAACDAEFVLYTDADDALMWRDPAGVVEALKGAGCDMLVSSTAYDLYHGMPQVKQQTIELAPAEYTSRPRPRIHLNAGVFVARRKFLHEYLEVAAEFVSDDDLPIKRLNRMSDEDLLMRLPEFPRGVGSDQTIMRYLLPQMYPRLQIDYAERLAVR